MNLFLARRAVKYFLKSRHKSGYGIHSPYIFNFFLDLNKNKHELSVVKSVEKARRYFLNSKKTIVVNDLGSGSLKMDERSRRVSDIARYSSTREKYIKLLSELTSLNIGKPVLELGTSLGIGTVTLALSAPESKVTTIEGCSNTAALAKESFDRLGIVNIEIINGNIEEVLVPFLKESDPPGLVFIDANHHKDPLIRYFDIISEFADNETVVVVDDIHLSRSMEEGWESIIKSNRVRVSVDVFQMGIVFFKRELTKQNYVIRY